MYGKSGTLIVFCCAMYAASFGAKQSATGALPGLIVSGKDNYWKTAAYARTASGTPDLIVNENSKQQTWEGFGGTFNEMGWDALQAVSSQIPTAMRLLFDSTDGANFSCGRVPIGASDYAMSWYTLDSTVNDYAMNDFSIARDREKLIPFIKQALLVKPGLHVWASPWIPPDWMKDASGNMKSDAQTQGAYALYLAKFVEAYALENITIEAVHPQNEPGYAQVHWAQSLLVDFFKAYLGPTFTRRGLSAQIWCGTMSSPVDTIIAMACKNDADIMKYVKGFGLQWNLAAIVPSLAAKGRVWQTEHRCGNYNFPAPYWDEKRYDSKKPQNDHLYAEESWQLIRDWITAGVNAYNAWNMVLDTSGASLGNWHQNSLLVVNRATKKLIATPAYYVFRHFSQYIAPGAVRLGTTGSQDAVAFKNPDGAVIAEVYNKNDATKTMTIGVADTLYRFDVPAHGWATLRVEPGTKTSTIADNRFPGNRNGLAITVTGKEYRIALPTRQAGRIDLLTAAGRVLESVAFAHAQGGRELSLLRRDSHTGVLFVRVTQGGTAHIRQIPIQAAVYSPAEKYRR